MKKLFICFLLFCLFLPVQAQKFEESTAADPRWYFIQVNGDGLTAGLVVTEKEGGLVGEAIKAGGLTEIARQLWRVERGNGSFSYHLINKYSGKKLDIVYSAERAERIAVLSETPSTEWRISASGDSYLLRVVTQPDGGTSGATCLTQAGRSSGYSLVFSTGGSANAQYHFIAYKTFPVASTETETAWYRIQNAKSSLAGKSLSDTGSDGACGAFLMTASVDGDLSQQWKIVSKTAPFDAGKVDFVNRATGHAIGTSPVYDRYYFLPATGDYETSQGWRLQLADSARYEIASGSLAAGWYWNAAADNESPASYSSSHSREDGFTWHFSLVEEVITGIRKTELQPGIRVYTQDKRIYVEGAEQYTVTSILGSRVKNDRPLSTGVYLVTVKGQTTKVLVK
jgi:hypothetical protein